MAVIVEHRRDVLSGDLWADTASGSGGGQEGTDSRERVWRSARDSAEDAALRSAAGLPAAAAPEAAQAGAVGGRDRRHSGKRQAATQETTAYGEADF